MRYLLEKKHIVIHLLISHISLMNVYIVQEPIVVKEKLHDQVKPKILVGNTIIDMIPLKRS